MSRMNPVEHDAPQSLQPQPQPGAAAADSAATAAAVPAVLPTTTSAARVTVTVLKILSRFSGVSRLLDFGSRSANQRVCQLSHYHITTYASKAGARL